MLFEKARRPFYSTIIIFVAPVPLDRERYILADAALRRCFGFGFGIASFLRLLYTHVVSVVGLFVSKCMLGAAGG